MTSTIVDHLYICFGHKKWYITKRQLHMLLLAMIALSQATATGNNNILLKRSLSKKIIRFQQILSYYDAMLL